MKNEANATILCTFVTNDILEKFVMYFGRSFQCVGILLNNRQTGFIKVWIVS